MADISYTLGLDGRGFAAGIRGAVDGLGKIGLAIDGVKKIAIGLNNAVSLAAGWESTQVAINTMLKDLTLTKAVMEQINQFADVTPFEPDEVIAASRALLGAKTSVGDLQSELQVLGDLAAGSGAELGNLAFVLNQVRGAGKLMTEDYYQFINAGVVGLRDELVKLKGIADVDFADAMSRGEISATDLWRAMQNLTGEGGKFYRAMVDQSATWNGLMSTATGYAKSLTRTLQQPLMEGLKPSLEGAIEGLKGATRFAQIFVNTLQMAAADDRFGDFIALSFNYGLKKGWVSFLEYAGGAWIGFVDSSAKALMHYYEWAWSHAWNNTVGLITGHTFDPGDLFGDGFFGEFARGLTDGVEEAEAKFNEFIRAGRLKLEADKQQAKRAMEDAGKAGGQAMADAVKQGLTEDAKAGKGSSADAEKKRIMGYSRERQGGTKEARQRAEARAEASAQKRSASMRKHMPGLEGAAEFRGQERPGQAGIYGDEGKPAFELTPEQVRPQRLRDTFQFPGLDSAFGARAGAAMSSPATQPGQQASGGKDTLVEIRDELRRIRTE